MAVKLTYAMLFVANMEQSVRFYRDMLGLRLKFQSPEWSEFITGDTTLALHPASLKNPAGTVRLGFGVAEMRDFYDEMNEKGISFTQPPVMEEEEGATLQARFMDPNGSEISVSGT